MELIKANKNVFELVIRNWLDNTIKYAQATSIKIVLVMEDKHYKISIIDNGKIDETTALKIQQQINNSNAIAIESDTGLGLGLIAYFSKMENWKINLMTSNVENEFVIYIPILA